MATRDEAADALPEGIKAAAGAAATAADGSATYAQMLGDTAKSLAEAYAIVKPRRSGGAKAMTAG